MSMVSKAVLIVVICTLVCAGALQFPLQVGNKHRFEKLPWQDGNGHSTDTCEVKGKENVTVPAGSFDTVRIECEGLWTRVFDGTFSGREIQNLWYSPAIKRFVKTQYTNYRSSGGVFDKTETQLVEFVNK